MDCASGGELHLALNAGFDPERIYLHGNNKSEAELEQAVAAGVGHVIVDSFDEIERLERVAVAGQRILLRVTPGIEPETHKAIRTGQEDSKFGIPMRDVERALERIGRSGLELRGLHAHIGSQVFDLDVYESLADVLRQIGDYPLLNLGGGFAIAYTREDRPPPAAEYAEAMLAHAPDGVTVLCEPGRSLVGNAGVSLYTVGTVKEIPGVRTYVAVDGGMADNIRPMLYGAVYEADVVDRFGDSTALPDRGHALRVRRRAGGRGCAGGPAPGRRRGHAGHRRVRSRDGKQLQRGAAAARGVLQGRRCTRWWCAARPTTT